MADILEFLKTPEGQGLLSGAFGYAANAKKGTPWNNAGRGGLTGLLGYNTAIDQQQQQSGLDIANQYRAAQMQQMQSDLEAKRLAQESMARYRATLPPEQQQIFDVAPQKMIESLPIFKNPQLVEVADPKEPLRTQKVWMRPGETTGPVAGFGAMPEILDPRVQAAKQKIAVAGRSTTPYYQFISTPEGVVAADARSGNVSMASVNGKPVVKASDDPTLQGNISQSKESGKTFGEESAKATLDYPRIVSNAETALKNVDEILKHPGFGTAVGKSSMFGVQKIPGTDAYDFINRLDQVKGGAFLEAFNTLKGGGQITEVEGKKATQAITRMDNATSEEEFRAAANDYASVIRNGMNRAKLRAGNKAKAPQGATFLGFE